ncbi:amidase signature enzyme [Mollisia scopiformis]|uniref:Amidase signature enzyme n=1 Tax=Mollisia scopiformis TaxID=149040 RepID=A0A194XAG0_MOLSC|nr:amidase signature enzyme [Mollisia scopiformis]KUJ17163.1 amidase signature enzyme [Mollisia scopiformis]
MATSMSSKGLRTVATSKLRGFIPTFPDQIHHTPLFNTLTATASDLQKELSNGKLRSTQVVEEYHRSIIAHNGVLNAVWELALGAMKRAEELDLLREKGQFLGPLHGIPILVKDNINLDPSFGIGTSGGAVALVDSVPASSATIVEKLLEAGAIILGKTTMSEMAYFKGSGIRCGWSAAAGHSQSAYVRGGLDMEDSIIGHSCPDGSSSGSAIAVSAGMTRVSIGTETFGSLAMPHSLIKYVEEATTQMNKELRAAYSKIEKLAKTYHGNISKLALEKSFDMPDGEDAISAALMVEVRLCLRKLLAFDIGRDLDPFLQDLTTSKIRSLKELVKWNIDHADNIRTKVLFVAATEVDHDEKKREEIASYTKAAGAKFLELFTEYDVDVIIAPTDSPLFLFSGAGAFPTAIPLSTIEFNGRPFGLTAAARAHHEGVLIKVMSAWESTFPARKTPEAFLTLKAIDKTFPSAAGRITIT